MSNCLMMISRYFQQIPLYWEAQYDFKVKLTSTAVCLYITILENSNP